MVHYNLSSAEKWDSASGALQQAPGRKPRCAVIDDDVAYLHLMRMYQHRLGLDIEIHESILSLGRISQLAGFDIVILDYKMPGVSGLEIAQSANALFGFLPIVLVTGCDVHEIPWAAVGPNIQAVVSKGEGVGRVGETLWDILSGVGWHANRIPDQFRSQEVHKVEEGRAHPRSSRTFRPARLRGTRGPSV